MTQPVGRIVTEHFSYQHATRSTQALSNVSLSIEPGQKILLTGDSGAGKSTLLMAIAGLLSDAEEGIASGHLEVTGTVGLVLQDPDSQVISSRVGDDVAFGCENMNIPREEIWRRVDKSLDLVGLDLPRDHPTSKLSGGQKQRLALAGVMAMGADIILLDEPTANLDPEGRRLVVESVKRVATETSATLVIVEHRGHHWLPIVDDVWHLDSVGGISRGVSLPELPALPPAQPVSSEAAVTLREVVTRAGGPYNFSFPAGTSTVVTGANGVGKSTLALTIAGLLEPESGTIDYSDAVRDGLAGPSWQWRSSELASRIGYVFQDPEHQFVSTTVREDLQLSGAQPEVIEELGQRLRLSHLLDVNPFTLSGGEKRRLSVAITLANAPGVVILDEPTFGQDEETFVEMVDIVRALTSRGVAVISITHDELYINSLGDHRVEMHR